MQPLSPNRTLVSSSFVLDTLFCAEHIIRPRLFYRPHPIHCPEGVVRALGKFIIQYSIWGYSQGWFTLYLLYSICIWSLPAHPTILLTLSTLCLSTVLIFDYLFHSWIDPSTKIVNPHKAHLQSAQLCS